eukprot:TRINITY_DN11378_c0_g1_i3.p1 TRINITY_DN11378_c0_g1~~TRINITY_DN11378_c0_g1_i3.p1  ORF type:complete len:546 (-),score=92.20 TRINITY_DN11378_c0_g1_i3:28-1665(-)
MARSAQAALLLCFALLAAIAVHLVLQQSATPTTVTATATATAVTAVNMGDDAASRLAQHYLSPEVVARLREALKERRQPHPDSLATPPPAAPPPSPPVVPLVTKEEEVKREVTEPAKPLASEVVVTAVKAQQTQPVLKTEPTPQKQARANNTEASSSNQASSDQPGSNRDEKTSNDTSSRQPPPPQKKKQTKTPTGGGRRIAGYPRMTVDWRIDEPDFEPFLRWVEGLEDPTAGNFPRQCHQYYRPDPTSGLYMEGEKPPYAFLVARMLYPYRYGITPSHLAKIPPNRLLFFADNFVYSHGEKPNHIRWTMHPAILEVANYVPAGTVIAMRDSDYPETTGNDTVVFGFCRKRENWDLLVSYGVPYQFPTVAWEPKEPRLVWGGLAFTERRLRVATFSRDHPEVIHAWCHSERCDEKLGKATGLGFNDQISRYRYLLHVDGFCGSERLERQLGSGSLTFAFEDTDELWYAPMLQANVTHVEVPEPFEVRRNEAWFRVNIAEGGARRVSRFVNHDGTRCYTALLLRAYHALQRGITIPNRNGFMMGI